MADLKKLAEDATTNAVLAAGKDAAKRAARDLLGEDEEAESKEAEKPEASKNRRTKLIVLAVLTLFVVIGVLGLLMSYWHWFLLAGLLGLGGFYARWRWRRRKAAKLEQKETPEVKTRVAEIEPAQEESGRSEAEMLARDAHARAEALAAEEAALDDELASLKARLNK